MRFFFHILSSTYVFQNNRFQKILPGALSKCPEQDRGSVGPDLVPANCLQRLSADDKSRRCQEKCFNFRSTTIFFIY